MQEKKKTPIQNIDEFLTSIRIKDEICPEKVLWPGTEISEIQNNMAAKQGATDYSTENPDCRTTLIAKHLLSLILAKKIPIAFTLVDLGCGDAKIIKILKQIFPRANIIGVDIWSHESHIVAKSFGVKFYYCYMQDIVKHRISPSVDVVLLLNSYRNWEASCVTDEFRFFLEEWLRENSKHTIVTTLCSQDELNCRGFSWVVRIGRGEGRSNMVCMTKRG